MNVPHWVLGFCCALASEYIKSGETDLLDEVAPEGDVPTSFVRDGHGNDVGQSLCLMDDCVSVGQVLPVLHPDLTASHHMTQLLLDLVCAQTTRFLSMSCCTSFYLDTILVWCDQGL